MGTEPRSEVLLHYEITNVLNGKSYVGQRMTPRMPENGSYFGSGKYLTRGRQRAWERKLHERNHLEYLNEAEEFFIRELHTHVFECGHNILLKHVGGTSGKCWTLSEETRKRMSKAAKDRIISEEVRQRISEKLKGKKHSEEAHQRSQRRIAVRRDHPKVDNEWRKYNVEGSRLEEYNEAAVGFSRLRS